MWRRRAFIIGICLTLTGVTAADEPNRLRGMNLYDNHCTICHKSTVHIREKLEATSVDEIRAFIWRWAAVQKLPWSESEVEDVLLYLNSTYYKY